MSRMTKPAIGMKIGTVGLVLAFFAGGQVFAQPQGSQASPTVTAPSAGQQPAQASPPTRADLIRVHRLIGKEVVNPQAERLGTLKDLVLDEHDMSISYGVLEYTGPFDVGTKLFAVPWSDFQTQPERAALVLDVRRQNLEAAPGLPGDRWPTAADKDWAEHVRMYSARGGQGAGLAETQPSIALTATAVRPFKYRRVTQLVGLQVTNYDQQRLASLDDLVIHAQPDPDAGRVAYGVLALRTGFLDLERELAIVPWTAVQVVPPLNAIRMDTTRQALDAVAVDESHFPDLNNTQYAQSVNERFPGRPAYEVLGYAPAEERTGSAMAASGRSEVSAWMAGSAYNRHYDPAMAEVLTGTVDRLTTFRPSIGAIEGVALWVKTPGGRSVVVQMGPRPYMDRQELRLEYGDTLKITGVPALLGLETVFIGSQVQKGDQTLILRDADGTPRWNAESLVTQQPAQANAPSSPQQTYIPRWGPDKPGEEPMEW